MDLDMLKAVTDDTARKHDPLSAAGRWDEAEEAVNGVLLLLRERHDVEGDDYVSVLDVYDAIKSAYVGSADWGDDEGEDENGGDR